MLDFISEGLINYSFLFCFLVSRWKRNWRDAQKKHILYQDSILNKKYILTQNTVVRNVSFDLVHIFVLIVPWSIGCKPWVFRPNVLYHRIQNLENYHGMIPSQIDRTDVRHWAIFWIKSQFSREMYFDTVVRNAFFDLIYVVVLVVHIPWTRAKLYIPSIYQIWNEFCTYLFYFGQIEGMLKKQGTPPQHICVPSILSVTSGKPEVPCFLNIVIHWKWKNRHFLQFNC